MKSRSSKQRRHSPCGLFVKAATVTPNAPNTPFAFARPGSRKSEEVAEITQLLDSRRERMKDGWLSARTIAFGQAEKLPSLPPNVTPNDVAAWTVAARVLLNLDETLTKN